MKTIIENNMKHSKALHTGNVLLPKLESISSRPTATEKVTTLVDRNYGTRNSLNYYINRITKCKEKIIPSDQSETPVRKHPTILQECYIEEKIVPKKRREIRQSRNIYDLPPLSKKRVDLCWEIDVCKQPLIEQVHSADEIIKAKDESVSRRHEFSWEITPVKSSPPYSELLEVTVPDVRDPSEKSIFKPTEIIWERYPTENYFVSIQKMKDASKKKAALLKASKRKAYHVESKPSPQFVNDKPKSKPSRKRFRKKHYYSSKYRKNYKEPKKDIFKQKYVDVDEIREFIYDDMPGEILPDKASSHLPNRPRLSYHLPMATHSAAQRLPVVSGLNKKQSLKENCETFFKKCEALNERTQIVWERTVSEMQDNLDEAHDDINNNNVNENLSTILHLLAAEKSKLPTEIVAMLMQMEKMYLGSGEGKSVADALLRISSETKNAISSKVEGIGKKTGERFSNSTSPAGVKIPQPIVPVIDKSVGERHLKDEILFTFPEEIGEYPKVFCKEDSDEQKSKLQLGVVKTKIVWEKSPLAKESDGSEDNEARNATGTDESAEVQTEQLISNSNVTSQTSYLTSASTESEYYPWYPSVTKPGRMYDANIMEASNTEEDLILKQKRNAIINEILCIAQKTGTFISKTGNAMLQRWMAIPHSDLYKNYEKMLISKKEHKEEIGSIASSETFAIRDNKKLVLPKRKKKKKREIVTKPIDVSRSNIDVAASELFYVRNGKKVRISQDGQNQINYMTSDRTDFCMQAGDFDIKKRNGESRKSDEKEGKVLCEFDPEYCGELNLLPFKKRYLDRRNINAGVEDPFPANVPLAEYYSIVTQGSIDALHKMKDTSKRYRLRVINSKDDFPLKRQRFSISDQCIEQDKYDVTQLRRKICKKTKFEQPTELRNPVTSRWIASDFPTKNERASSEMVQPFLLRTFLDKDCLRISDAQASWYETDKWRKETKKIKGENIPDLPFIPERSPSKLPSQIKLERAFLKLCTMTDSESSAQSSSDSEDLLSEDSSYGDSRIDRKKNVKVLRFKSTAQVIPPCSESISSDEPRIFKNLQPEKGILIKDHDEHIHTSDKVCPQCDISKSLKKTRKRKGDIQLPALEKGLELKQKVKLMETKGVQVFREIEKETKLDFPLWGRYPYNKIIYQDLNVQNELKEFLAKLKTEYCPIYNLNTYIESGGAYAVPELEANQIKKLGKVRTLVSENNLSTTPSIQTCEKVAVKPVKKASDKNRSKIEDKKTEYSFSSSETNTRGTKDLTSSESGPV